MENNVLNRTDVMRYGSMDLGLDSKYLDVVRQGMYKVVNEPGGTATSVRIPDVVMCGKTGTAQNPHGKDHSWFVCFAPMDKPVIAICVMVENAGFGSTVAAPIAKAMVELYVKGRWPQGMEPPTKPKPPAQSPDSTGAGEGIPVDSALPKPVEVPEPKGPFMLAGK
jgi:membrane peptidoglycan carboxypeptidase